MKGWKSTTWAAMAVIALAGAAGAQVKEKLKRSRLTKRNSKD